MPGWIDAPTLRNFIKDNLARDPSVDLKQHWDSIVDAAVLFGYWEIVAAFAERGFSKAQVDQWDRGLEFHRDLGAWYAIRRLQVLQPDSYSDKALTVLDRRMDLRGDKTKDWPAAVLTIAGEPQTPAGTYGMPQTVERDTSEDLFLLDTDDSRIGVPTRF